DLLRVGPQRRHHLGLEAVDMDVELVLRAAAFGIDREPDLVAWERTLGAQLGEAARLPGGGEEIGRVRRQQFRRLDAGQARRRDQQVLRVADEVLEDRAPALLAIPEIDLRAWRRPAIGLL